jgi:hypothetical protein
MTDDSQLAFGLPSVSRKKVTAAFDGGRLSSDGGVMLLALADRCRKVADTLASFAHHAHGQGVASKRNARGVSSGRISDHAISELLAQGRPAVNGFFVYFQYVSPAQRCVSPRIREYP